MYTTYRNLFINVRIFHNFIDCTSMFSCKFCRSVVFYKNIIICKSRLAEYFQPLFFILGIWSAIYFLAFKIGISYLLKPFFFIFATAKKTYKVFCFLVLKPSMCTFMLWRNFICCCTVRTSTV